MELKLGEKIKSLRKEKNVSQALSEDGPAQDGGQTFCEYYGKEVLEQIRTWKEAGHTPRPSLCVEVDS